MDNQAMLEQFGHDVGHGIGVVLLIVLTLIATLSGVRIVWEWLGGAVRGDMASSGGMSRGSSGGWEDMGGGVYFNHDTGETADANDPDSYG